MFDVQTWMIYTLSKHICFLVLIPMHEWYLNLSVARVDPRSCKVYFLKKRKSATEENWDNTITYLIHVVFYFFIWQGTILHHCASFCLHLAHTAIATMPPPPPHPKPKSCQYMMRTRVIWPKEILTDEGIKSTLSGCNNWKTEWILSSKSYFFHCKHDSPWYSTIGCGVISLTPTIKTSGSWWHGKTIVRVSFGCMLLCL